MTSHYPTFARRRARRPFWPARPELIRNLELIEKYLQSPRRLTKSLTESLVSLNWSSSSSKSSLISADLSSTKFSIFLIRPIAISSFVLFRNPKKENLLDVGIVSGFDVGLSTGWIRLTTVAGSSGLGVMSSKIFSFIFNSVWDLLWIVFAVFSALRSTVVSFAFSSSLKFSMILRDSVFLWTFLNAVKSTSVAD